MDLKPLLSFLVVAACKGPADPDLPPTIEERVEDLLSQMSLEEKVAQMHGSGITESELWITARNERLGIPGFAMSDGPRGVTAGTSTTFPVAIARGASFDPELERRIAAAIAQELSAKGGHVLLAPAMNLLRHPGWGRAQETYGEDTHHLGVMARAFVEGAQEHVIATPKHFAVNSIEDTRFDVDVTIDERSLRELYLPHFRAVAEDGAGAFMSAYNSINGAYAAENRPLLTDILKEEWQYDGLVMSDWIWGTHDTVGAATAGLDIEMPSAVFYGDPLVQAVQSGTVPLEHIDDSVRRILRTKLRFGLDQWTPASPDVVEAPEHIALALEASLASMVLLKNDSETLPLASGGEVAVLGRLADIANLGDEGSSNAHPSYAVTPLEGIEAAAARAGATVTRTDDPTVAAQAAAAVVVVGLTSDDEGESIPFMPGGDRDSLGLDEADVALIESVAAVQPNTVVVLEGGSAITVDPWEAVVPAIVMAWYPGMEGGTALGQLLFGEANFRGRMPVSVPVDEADLPVFDHVSHAVTYDYWHGYRHLDRTGVQPRYGFLHGLSYTRFDYTAVQVEGLTVTVEVHNVGDRSGDEVIGVFLAAEAPLETTPHMLAGFARVQADPGERATAVITIPEDALLHWQDGWKNLATSWMVEVGPDHTDLRLSASLQQ